jgi:hypothetical protein
MAPAPVGLTAEGVSANPYANYGYPVTGTEFVGRLGNIRSIRSRTFTLLETASVSIVGPPRIGKSSVARYVRDEFAAGKSPKGLLFLPVWITVSGTGSEQSIFRDLAERTQGWLTGQGLDVSKVKAPYEALCAAVSWDDMRMRLMTYLQELRRSGYQVIAVLDEFDAARKVFNSSAPFELLRTIAYEPEIRIALITASRRTLKDIVVQSTAELSTFPGIFGQPEILGCFDSTELAELIARSPYTRGKLRNTLLSLLEKETGGQPFLSSALLSVLHHWWAADGPPSSTGGIEKQFDKAVVVCGRLILDHHDAMLELLREEARLTTLFEVLFGPQVTAGPVDAERMAQEGIIKKTDDGWTAYSESFQQYLGRLEDTLTSESHMLWPKTEVGLRAALTTALEAAYGDGWQARLRESQPRLVRECEGRRAHVPDISGGNLLDYTQPGELLSIMMMHWAQIEPFFGHGREEWRARLEFVKKMRVPLAHSRRAEMSPQNLEEFRVTCQEMLRWLAAAPARRG